MAGRFVRSTKFRHVFGTAYKKDACYDSIKISKSPWESNMSDVNSKFLAVVIETQGGGSFQVIPVSKTGRLDTNYPKVSGHEGKILDIAFDPFNDNRIASSSDDCTIKIWDIPDTGITEDIKSSTMTLEGHQRKVGSLAWHRSAENILASGSNDGVVIIWDLETQQSVYTIEMGGEDIHSLSWNEDGDLLAVSTKSKPHKLCIVDPRKNEIILRSNGHDGNKPIKLTFVSKNRVFTTGFSKSSERQYALWDLKNFDKPLTMETIDDASGVQNIFYDHENKIAYLVGKGDSQIRYYEIVDDSPYVHFLSMFQSTTPQRSCASMPKRHMIASNCEIARLYKLQTKGCVEPITMVVPRKSSMFQEDIYPPCFAGVPAMSASDWIGGMNKKPMLVSVKKDGLGPVQSGGTISLKVSGTSSGNISKQSSVSSSASEALKLERENSPISLTASGDFDDSHYKKEIEGLKAENEKLKSELRQKHSSGDVDALKAENQRLKAELEKKEAMVKKIKDLVN